MKDVTLTVWMKHPAGRRYRKDAEVTVSMEEATARIAQLYRMYNSTDIRCEVRWSA